MTVDHISIEDVTVCMLTFNEEFFLPVCLERLVNKFPKFVFLDMESEDQTTTVIQDLLGSRSRIITRPRSELFLYGFAEARNLLAAMSNSPWVLFVDADEMLNRSWEGNSIPNPTGHDFFRITRRNLPFVEGLDFRTDELGEVPCSNVESHVRLYKRSPAARWESYIHEELWLGESRVHELAPLSELSFDHVSAFRMGTGDFKENLYSWMLMRARSNPNYSYRMRDYYYNGFIEERMDQFIARAACFSESFGYPD